MKQNDFYEVDGCMDFIPVTINETYADGVGVTVDNYMQGYRLVVKEVYRFPKVNEPQKVVVPKFVADWIEECKRDRFYALHGAFTNMDNELKRWRCWGGHSELFAKAWMYGYEIEQEKLYTVEIEGISSGKLFKNIKTNKYLFHSGNGLKGYTDGLTEQEIKQKDERLWQWAVEVEESK